MKHIILTLAVLVLPLTAGAEVLASVGGETFTYEELITMIGGEEYLSYLGIYTEADAEAILDSWVSEELLIQSAESAGLESDPDVAIALEEARRKILLEAYLISVTESIQQPSQLEILNYAGTWEDTYSKEINESLIVVPDEILANSLLAQINSGEDFAGLAASYGAEIGWITRGQVGSMQFDEIAFRLNAGGVSEVFEIDGGYYIAKVEAVEALSPAPSTEDIIIIVGQELLRVAQEEALIEVIDELRSEFNIQIYPDRLMEHL